MGMHPHLPLHSHGHASLHAQFKQFITESALNRMQPTAKQDTPEREIKAFGVLFFFNAKVLCLRTSMQTTPPNLKTEDDFEKELCEMQNDETTGPN